jgi:uncharacterized protein YdeI (YjbR/CyaY-like superfamily)
MQLYKNIKTFYAKDIAAWRAWLQKNGEQENSVWLIIYKKQSGTPSIYYSEAVDEALCFGWIDSTPNKRDDNSYYQFFAKRNPKSNWSQVNKLKVEKLIAEGRMTAQGMKMIELAKQKGTWDALNEVDEIIIPDDLQQALTANKTAQQNFEAFSRSSKRGILEWVLNAKKPETRQKRIAETVALAAKILKANHKNG